MPSPSTYAEASHPAKPGVESPVVTHSYGLGDKVVPNNSHEALAKEVFDPSSGRVSYWLKRATQGPDAGRLFNPQSPTFNPDQARRVHDSMGKGQYEFRKASQQSFDFYRKFLASGNVLNLRHAERW